MKTVERFVDEISQREFKTVEEAIASEKRHGGIKKLFGFWKEHKLSLNNDECVSRTQIDYLRLQEALVKGVREYEPWIAKQYEKHNEGGITAGHMVGGYIIGRYLSDGNSDLYHWYGILSCICQKCYREFNQPYCANHCTHSIEPVNGKS